MEKKLYYTAKEVSEILVYQYLMHTRLSEKLTKNLRQKDILSELAELAVSILIARFMTYATEQHKGKEQLYGSIQG